MSTLADARSAGAEAAQIALARLGSQARCCVMFGTTGYHQDELLGGVRSATGDVPVVGCSGEGVIARDVSDESDHCVTVLALTSSTMNFHVIAREDYVTAPEDCGKGLAADVAALGGRAFAMMVFTDGLGGHCTRFLAALQEHLPSEVVVVGGTAGDAMEFFRTYQYTGDRVISGGVSALVLCGEGTARVAVSHGCSPIGLERVVTSASDGWLQEIDGRSAWSAFKEYLDGDPVDLNAEGIVHLCFGEPLAPDRAQDYDPFIIRTPLQLNPATGALFFPGGGFVTGSSVRLTRRDPERIRKSAERCAQSLVGNARPAFVVQFDCAGRGRILFGSRTSDEIVSPLQRVLGHDLPWVGVHTYGEIAPVGDRLYYHNYTVALCCVYDPD